MGWVGFILHERDGSDPLDPHTMYTDIQSVGVALAGVVIYFKPHWQIVDPICTIVFSILICYSTLSVRPPRRDMCAHACLPKLSHQKPHAYLPIPPHPTNNRNRCSPSRRTCSWRASPKAWTRTRSTTSCGERGVAFCIDVVRMDVYVCQRCSGGPLRVDLVGWLMGRQPHTLTRTQPHAHPHRRIRGVTDVHDLHIWMLSIGRPIVTVHIKAADPEFVRSPLPFFLNLVCHHSPTPTHTPTQTQPTHASTTRRCARPRPCSWPRASTTPPSRSRRTSASPTSATTPASRSPASPPPPAGPRAGVPTCRLNQV